MIFRLAAPAIIIFVEPAGVALHQIGDDEARVGPPRAGLDAGDDALDAAPARGPVVKLFVTARLAILRRGFVAGFRAGLKIADVASQCRVRRHHIGAQHDFGPRPVRADGAQQPAQDGHDLLAAWPFGGTQHGVKPRKPVRMRLGRAMVALYCESFHQVPGRITLDIDDTFDAVHGGQQLRLFNAHYDEYGFQPIVVFDGAGRFITDSHYCCPEVLDFCRVNGLDYILGGWRPLTNPPPALNQAPQPPPALQNP